MTIIGGLIGYVLAQNTSIKVYNNSSEVYDEYDFISLLNVPSEQKNDCVHWALGDDWFKIKWNFRADRFRALHPELNHEDFSDATPTLLFWERVSKAYLNRK